MEDIGQFQKHNTNKVSKKGFNKFNLRSEVILNILKLGYKIPTPIQKKVIPELLAGFNVIAKSRTGSGKSASFIIPIIEKLRYHSEVVGVRAIVLSPTRELAKQTLDFFYKLSKGINLKFAVMTGGDKIEGQFEKLATNPDIIIATPGRLVQHIEESSVSLKKVELIIIDEADKLIEQGFEEQLFHIIKHCPQNKQIGLFSATIPERLVNFMKLGIKDYKLITLEEENKIPETLKLHMISCRSDQRDMALVGILKECIDIRTESSLIFCPTKYHCEYLLEYLKCYGIRTSTIYGNMDQNLRDENLTKFKNKETSVMLVTDVAARGLDIPKLENVINYDFPDKPKLFIHRIGRTARAGKFGRVISLITPMDLPYVFDTKLYIGKSINFKDPNGEDKENCEVISYGYIPNSVYERTKDHLSEYLKSRVDFDDLEKSMKNANMKREAFREKPSGAGVRNSKEIPKDLGISSLFLKNSMQLSNGDNTNQLAEMLKSFKPKKTIFEQVNTDTNLNDKVVNDLRNQNRRFLERKEYELKREQFKEAMEENENEETKSDQLGIQNGNIDTNKQSTFLGKKHKRTLHNEKVKESQYISDKPNDKVSLWGSEGPLNLNELTLNLCPDDLVEKKKSKYVWDEKKKRFVNGAMDKKGNLIRKNEAGVKIKQDEKRVSSYKKWMNKSRIQIQRAGEIEDNNLVANAKTKYKDRKASRGKAKQETKSYDQLVKERKDSSRKQFRFKGQTRAAREKQIGEKLHNNRRSMVLIRKKVKK